jgi:2-polyprenyl-3-methyl-5-hydroxy-6-metoxy-1,4-benzoquinol methylase
MAESVRPLTVDEKIEMLRHYAEVTMGGVTTLAALLLDDEGVVTLSDQAREDAKQFLAALVAEVVNDHEHYFTNGKSQESTSP